MGCDQQDNLYKRAVELWGVEAQVRMAVEECAELLKALMKIPRAESVAREKALDALSEEIADVQIMLDQLKYMFGVREKTERTREIKLARLALLIAVTEIKLDKSPS